MEAFLYIKKDLKNTQIMFKLARDWLKRAILIPLVDYWFFHKESTHMSPVDEISIHHTTR